MSVVNPPFWPKLVYGNTYLAIIAKILLKQYLPESHVAISFLFLPASVEFWLSSDIQGLTLGYINNTAKMPVSNHFLLPST